MRSNQFELEHVLRQSFQCLIGNGHNQVGTKFQVHVQASLIRNDGTLHSFEYVFENPIIYILSLTNENRINLGRDLEGKLFHESELYAEEKVEKTWRKRSDMVFAAMTGMFFYVSMSVVH